MPGSRVDTPGNYALPGKRGRASGHDSFEKLIPCGNPRNSHVIPVARILFLGARARGARRGIYRSVESDAETEVKAICNTGANWHVPRAKCGYLTGFLPADGGAAAGTIDFLYIRAAICRGDIRTMSFHRAEARVYCNRLFMNNLIYIFRPTYICDMPINARDKHIFLAREIRV